MLFKRSNRRLEFCESKLNIAFIHPDLGLGGAERLVVDAAAGLRDKSHTVSFWTAYFNPNRCFDELKGSDAIPVHTHGSWFPRSVFGKCIAFCAYIRTLITTFCLIFHFLLPRYRHSRPHVVVVDQVSIVIPFLRLLSYKVIYYCHFPDKLLAPGAGKSLSDSSGLSIQNIQASSKLPLFIRNVYRKPLNFFEEWSTGLANQILVNSLYTRAVFKAAFPSLARKEIFPQVLYPAVRLSAFFLENFELNQIGELKRFKHCILSINRFERKKNIPLVIHSFAKLSQLSPSHFTSSVLVIAGGYDERLPENKEVLIECKELVDHYGLTDQVYFFPSFSRSQQLSLLLHARDGGLLAYTPENEHFGIVPVEAMAAKVPVVAVNSGGPTESITNGVTGLLVDPTPLSFSQAFLKVIADPIAARNMGRYGRERSVSIFGLDAFASRLENMVVNVVCGNKKQE
ncbi:hypothetical protein P9112_003159 [Eukaryota sp. TZLM1-RC]